jgi:hypothetical protein
MTKEEVDRVMKSNGVGMREGGQQAFSYLVEHDSKLLEQTELLNYDAFNEDMERWVDTDLRPLLDKFSESCNKDGSDTTETDQNLQSIVRKMNEKGKLMDTTDYRKHYFEGNPCPNRYIQLMYPLRDAENHESVSEFLYSWANPSSMTFEQATELAPDPVAREM